MISLVVGHSRAPAGQEALRVARELAGRLNARLFVMHVVTLGDYPVNPDAADWDEQAQRNLAQQQEQVRTALAGCRQQWTYSVSRGDPVSVISSAAEKNDALMIIVGTRGHGVGPAIERMLGGSVSHGLIRRQHRPVLIVRAPRPGRGDAHPTSDARWLTRNGHGHAPVALPSAPPRDHNIVSLEPRRR
jgi:nucleotide-binding universal stress UspA family protein